MVNDGLTVDKIPRHLLLTIPNIHEDIPKALQNHIESLEEKLKNIEQSDKTEGLPHIPMGKNTHTKTTDGFVHNKTKITIQNSIKESPIHSMLNNRLKIMWNSLPDDVRDSISTFKIQKSRAKRGMRGGTFDMNKKGITINIHDQHQDFVLHSFYHEIGHARWDKIQKENPEKIEKFKVGIKEHGAPTKYAFSYYNAKSKYDEKEWKYRAYMKGIGKTITSRDEEIIQRNKKIYEDLYENECHAELNAIAMGLTDPKQMKGWKSKESINKLLDVYKEMWDL